MIEAELQRFREWKQEGDKLLQELLAKVQELQKLMQEPEESEEMK